MPSSTRDAAFVTPVCLINEYLAGDLEAQKHWSSTNDTPKGTGLEGEGLGEKAHKTNMLSLQFKINKKTIIATHFYILNNILCLSSSQIKSIQMKTGRLLDALRWDLWWPALILQLGVMGACFCSSGSTFLRHPESSMMPWSKHQLNGDKRWLL